MEQMKMEFPENVPVTDEQKFAVIDELIEQGWEPSGNIFQKDQMYRLVLNKGGEDQKEFTLMKPYPKSRTAPDAIQK